MSGSSLDGLDMAICQFKGYTKEEIQSWLLAVETIAYPLELQQRLSEAAELTAKDYLELEVDYSQFCAAAINQFLEEGDIAIDYVASHGHTVFHFPQLGFSGQIGSGPILAALTGIPTIYDFRSTDIAYGGQGAPLAPIVEQWLHPGYDLYINLGGIANISYHNADHIISFDSCPCNQILNSIAGERSLPYDDKGVLASVGTVIEELLDDSLATDYLAFPAPKSIDNTWVRDVFAPRYRDLTHSVEDRLATMVEFIAIQLALDIKRMTVGRGLSALKVLITGGGAHNDFLMASIAIHLGGNITIVKPEEMIINFKEAILISLMGYLRSQDTANTISSVTGATQPSIAGSIAVP